MGAFRQMSSPVVFIESKGTPANPERSRQAAGHGSTRVKFYCLISVILLLIVLVGFSRTFYLRTFLEGN